MFGCTGTIVRVTVTVSVLNEGSRLGPKMQVWRRNKSHPIGLYYKLGGDILWFPSCQDSIQIGERGVLIVHNTHKLLNCYHSWYIRSNKYKQSSVNGIRWSYRQRTCPTTYRLGNRSVGWGYINVVGSDYCYNCMCLCDGKDIKDTQATN